SDRRRRLEPSPTAGHRRALVAAEDAGGPRRACRRGSGVTLPPGSAPHGGGRRGEGRAALDGVKAPCSASVGRAIGLVGTGSIESVAIDGPDIVITVLPTFPDCLFRGVFEAEIEAQVKTLGWCRTVRVAFAPADQTWDETRMAPEALKKLGRK